MSHKAFTLSEILITLGVISVVAGLTIPNLISDYKKQRTVTQLKKAYSVMNNAFNYAESQYGPIATWPEVMHYAGRPQFDNQNEAKAFVDKYLAPSLGYYEYKFRPQFVYKSGHKSLSTGPGRDVKWFYLKDGTCFRLNFGISNQHSNLIFYDINGDAPPNSTAIDIFDFEIGHYSLYKFILSNGWYYPNFPNPDSKQIKENLTKTTCTTSKSYINGYYKGEGCGWLIQYEGWKIPKDYPFKF